jgi:hypothetical protein
MALFQRRRKRIPQTEQCLGLVVPPRARIIYDADGNIIFDELRVQEEQDRKRGRVIVRFHGGTGDRNSPPDPPDQDDEM